MYGMLMECVSDMEYGFHKRLKESAWPKYGIWMEYRWFQWKTYITGMACVHNLNGTDVNMHGICMEYVWNMHGI